MEINKIEIGNNCFGSFVRVNDIDFNIDPDFLSMKEQKEVDSVMVEVVERLKGLRRELSMSDWHSILDIIATLEEFEYDSENSYNSTCEQCGDWNSSTIYNK